MKMQCPFCSAPLDIPDKYAGQEVTCAACNEKFFADFPGYSPRPARQEQAVDRLTPALFKQFVTIEDSMGAIRSKVIAQVWTCVGLLLGGILMMVFGWLVNNANNGATSSMTTLLWLVGSLMVLCGILCVVFFVQYWIVYKFACWRTIAINSGVPVVYAADPKRAQRG